MKLDFFSCLSSEFYLLSNLSIINGQIFMLDCDGMSRKMLEIALIFIWGTHFHLPIHTVTYQICVAVATIAGS